MKAIRTGLLTGMYFPLLMLHLLLNLEYAPEREEVGMLVGIFLPAACMVSFAFMPSDVPTGANRRGVQVGMWLTYSLILGGLYLVRLVGMSRSY